MHAVVAMWYTDMGVPLVLARMAVVASCTFAAWRPVVTAGTLPNERMQRGAGVGLGAAWDRGKPV